MSRNTTSIPAATLVARSMSTMSSNEAARATEAPNVSMAHRMTALAGAVSKRSLTAARSSSPTGWSLT